MNSLCGPDIALRDEIAISLLPGIVSAYDGGSVADAAKELGIKTEEYVWRTHWPILAAIRAYEFANAMLMVRNGGWASAAPLTRRENNNET